MVATKLFAFVAVAMAGIVTGDYASDQRTTIDVKPKCTTKPQLFSTEPPRTMTTPDTSASETPMTESPATEAPTGSTTAPNSPCSDSGPNMVANTTWNATDTSTRSIDSFKSCCEWCWQSPTCKGFTFFSINWGRGKYKECFQTSDISENNLAPTNSANYVTGSFIR